MARIFTPRVRRSAGSRRKTLWLDFAIETAQIPVAAATSILLSSLNAAALSLRPFTVVRTRFQVGWASDQVAATEFPFGAFGVAIVSDQASAIGVTAIPTPITDAGSSLFLAYQSMMSNLQFSNATGYTPTLSSWEIDSKAMRKVEIGQDLVVTVENSSAAHGAQFLVQGRILVKTN